MSLEIIPNDLLEYILSYTPNIDIKNFGYTTTHHNTLIYNCLKHKIVYDRIINSCLYCKLFVTTPLTVIYASSNIMEDRGKFLLCSGICRQKFIYTLPFEFYCITLFNLK